MDGLLAAPLSASEPQPGSAAAVSGSHDAAAAVARIRQRNPKADPLAILPDVHPGKIPRHIAIIMDGNGRWATRRGLPRALGHRQGAKSVHAIVDAAGRLGVEVLTLYSFSMENWKRPRDEVDALMALYLENMASQAEKLMSDNVRFRQIGRRAELPAAVQQRVAELEARTAGNTAATLCLAVNYGSRAEIADATRAIAEKVARGELKPDEITEQTLARHLYTADLPDPDLLIRTAGEMRVSNYLLWQISYAELHVTDVLWPDFGEAELHAAIRDFAGRTRKFGGLSA
ncbi:MAG: isoprenyl transferase [bacterium]|jgi:undecaprenyl diphosphate synthase|nr:isoprenyl transferase [Phycisphaerales bacterium]MCE2653175.1 isoprenyl transferase [Planctomycetaceae bacterium]